MLVSSVVLYMNGNVDAYLCWYCCQTESYTCGMLHERLQCPVAVRSLLWDGITSASTCKLVMGQTLISAFIGKFTCNTSNHLWPSLELGSRNHHTATADEPTVNCSP